MKMQIYAIRDRATDQYANPMFMLSNGHAIRGFADELNREADDNMLRRHPEDFDLYHLGEYDTDTGLFNTDRPQQIAIGKDLRVANGPAATRSQ